MKRMISLFCMLAMTFAAFSSEVKDLRCEMMVDPQGIATAAPRLSWIITSNARNVEQASYEITAASSAEKLGRGEADLWSSGPVKGSQSIMIPYAGTPLKSRSAVYWKVKITTNKGETIESKPAAFSVGLLDENEWTGQWIGLDRAFPWDSETHASRLSARYFRKDFSTKPKNDIKSAKVYIAGLGIYELYINGGKIGDQVLAPVPTDYTKTVIYNTFDVTPYVKSGKNTIGTILGNGYFYSPRQNYKPHKINHFGYPKMLVQLEIEYADGSKAVVASDNTWKVTSDGPIRSNNDLNGEEYDATKELGDWSSPGYKDSKWLKVQLVEAPGGKLSGQASENLRIMETVKPVSAKYITPDTLILDMGQNMVGWLELRAAAKKGDSIRIRFAETLEPNGRLYTKNLRSARQTDVYTFKGTGTERWEPRFVLHGFRYAEVTGFSGKLSVDNFTGKVVYDNIATTGTFESSNPMLNQIHKNAYWGIRGNYRGIPLDCPQRDERQPWLGDRTIGSLGESFIFDNGTLYAKWLNDIEDSQTAEGTISDICPPFYMTYFSDNMTWPGTYITVADMVYTQFGDVAPIKKHYASMRKWLMHMVNTYMSPDYIMTKDKYGDWCVPPESQELIHSQDPARKTDGQLIATAYSIKFLQLMQRFAMLSGKPGDAAEYAALEAKMKKAFNAKFYNAETGQYSNHTVTANLLPLAFGIVETRNEDRVFGNMINKIVVDDKMHLSTGVIGTQWLMRELTKRGKADVAYSIAVQKTYPGWGYMVENGATTIWELWNGNTANPSMNSHNHVMLLGDLITWMYQDLAGIRTHKNNQGFKMLWMKPNPTEDLKHVNASHRTPYGLVRSNWKLDNGVFTWNLTIPANTRANILIPAAMLEDITENGKPVMQVEGLKYVRKEEGRVNLEIGSGEYTFKAKYGIAQNRWQEGVVSHEFICENPSFPESHASTIAQNSQGDLVAAWFGGTKERNPDVCVWVSRHVNGKWSDPVNVANGIINDTLRYATWNPVLYQVPGGELQLYYKVGPNVAAWTARVVTSADGGKTWSAPKHLPDGFLGPVKNKPVLLKDGTLIAPSSTEGQGGWRVHMEMTKNFGKTWIKGANIDVGKGLYAIQPSVLVYKDGKLQILCRTRNRVIAESWSTDNGRTWSPLAESSLPNNNSGTDAVTLRDGRQLLVYNHVLPADSLPNGKGARTPLNVAVSEDGKTWYAAVVIEDSPIGQYSYPSVIQGSDGMVHVVYTWRRKAIKHIVIDPNKLVLSRIEDKKWPSERETSAVNVVNMNRYKVSACDWMMLKRQKVGAMELGREIGADGIEIDMGGLGSNISFDNKLTDPAFQQLFIQECNRLGIEFSSVAISAFYGQSFAKRDNYESLIDETIASMKGIGVKTAFLPLGNQCDIVKEPELYPIVLERLKVAAKKAEAAGVVIGIETTLSAKDEAALIDKIGSPGIRSYVNFSSVIKRGGNIIEDLKTLGKDRIVQIHVSNTDGFWIQNDPALDMAGIKKTLDAMGWSGWLVVERSRDTADVHNVKRNYGANVQFLKSFFQE